MSFPFFICLPGFSLWTMDLDMASISQPAKEDMVSGCQAAELVVEEWSEPCDDIIYGEPCLLPSEVVNHDKLLAVHSSD